MTWLLVSHMNAYICTHLHAPHRTKVIFCFFKKRIKIWTMPSLSLLSAEPATAPFPGCPLFPCLPRTQRYLYSYIPGVPQCFISRANYLTVLSIISFITIKDRNKILLLRSKNELSSLKSAWTVATFQKWLGVTWVWPMPLILGHRKQRNLSWRPARST